MGSSLTPDRVRQMRLLFEQVAMLAPAERTTTLDFSARTDAELRRTVDALLAVDARGESVLRQLGAPASDYASLSRWDRLRALLAQASALSPAERDALLDALSDRSEPLRGDLSDLLEAHDQAPAVLDTPLPDLNATGGPGPPPGAPASPPGDDLIGRTIAHYRIVGRLGKGGMGVVYKALDTNLDRPVAVKFLPPELHADADAEARFVHEARAVSALDHPNIAVVHEIGRTNEGQRFIVMGYYAGETLRQKIAWGPLPILQVIDHGLQMARGLQRAHEHGIVHRDIKPENVIVTDRGLLKILDFGLAKRQDVQLTATGMTMGTIAYMSPEQTFGGDVDHRTDIWALGVVLFEILTAQHPFMPGKKPLPEGTADSIAAAAKALRPDAPERLTWIVEAMLRKDPARRYQHMSQVVDNLEMLREPVSSAAMTGAMPTQAVLTQAMPTAGPMLTADAPKGLVHLLPKTWKGRLALGLGAVLVVLSLVLWGVSRPPGTFAPGGAPGAPASALRAQAQEFARTGLSYLGEGQLTLARTELERALAVDSTYSEAWSTLAAVHFRRGAYDEAITASRRALRLDSTDTAAYYNLALALEESGRYDEAIRAYTAALGVDSTFVQAYSALANLYIAQGRANEGLAVLEQAVRAAPATEYLFLIYKNMGKGRLSLKEPEAAIEALERSLRLRPDWPETLALMAEAHAALGRTEPSRAYLQRYLEVETDIVKRQAVLEKLGRQ